MKKRALLSLAVLCVATGCSFKSPADDLDFKAPAGWNGTPGIMGFQMWMKPNKDGEMVMLINRKGKMKQDFDVRTIPGTTSAEVSENKEIRICGNQPAKLMIMSVTTNGKTATTELILTTYADDNNYMAMYSRPKTAKPDPEAESAIRMLCLKKG